MVKATDDAPRCLNVAVLTVSDTRTEAEVWGIYHYCSSEETNCYEFGETAMAIATQYSELGSGSVELEKLVEMPPIINRVLDCSKIRNTFAIQQAPWRNAIGESVKRYFDARH
jgi:dTDP-4-dehydrorhamnose reductase